MVEQTLQSTPAMSTDPMLRKEYYWRQKEALWSDRSSWDDTARDMAAQLLPRSSRFTTSETNKGTPKHNKIYDNSGMGAVDILAAGMMSGLTSPARPWFKLKHADDDLMAYEPVKVWCADVTRRILSAMGRSNIYRTFHQGYTEQGVFGTHASVLMPHPKRLIHSTSFTWGEYALAINADGEVDTLYREMAMTARAIIMEFGWEKVSQSVRNAWEKGDMTARFDVIHAIEPNPKADEGKLDWRSMPYRSVYFEKTTNVKEYLRESGFRRFRGICPRWLVTTSTDTYGTSPGMRALGDSKQLQHEQFRKAQGIDYQTKPPVGLPTSLKGQETDLLPGGVSYFDTVAGTSGQRQLFESNLNLADLKEDIWDVRGRIRSAFFADLFLMISSQDQNMTATEVAERHEEKLLMIGPVLERQHNENITPTIDIVFDELAAQGQLPPPPPELEGQPLETELLGLLAQAQRAVQVNTLDRVFMGAATLAQFRPEVVDKIDTDAALEIYADSLGADPRILVDDREVAQIRQRRAEAQAQAAQQAQAMEAAKGVSELGKVPTNGGASNAGADVIGMFSGYQSPQAERLSG